MKFKVGDIIRGKENLYTFTDEDMTKAVVLKTNDLCNSMEIEILEHINQRYVHDKYEVSNDDSEFELIDDVKEIIIRQVNGKKIIATDNRHPESTVHIFSYDFNDAAKLALEKIIEKDEESKTYNAKVVCINNKWSLHLYTPGKIYEVVNGRITNDENETFPCDDGDRFKDFEELNRRCAGEFLEVVE